MKPRYKYPVSVLVVIHTPALEVLLLERVGAEGRWQSVTGSLEAGEVPQDAAVREVAEETGLQVESPAMLDWRHTNRFRIRGDWRPLYAPEVTHNTEHVFSLCVPEACEVQLELAEHVAQQWLPHTQAAEKVFSWSNREAILRLPEKLAEMNEQGRSTLA